MSDELDINDSDTVEAIDRMHENPATPPPRDWKPVAGEKVLVEAVYCDPYGDGYHNLEFVDMHSWYRQERVGFAVPLSSIRPMTRKEGE